MKGVAIHNGGADYGHYYAIIKYDKWYKFNDSEVKIFDMKNFSEECFGWNENQSNEEYYNMY